MKETIAQFRHTDINLHMGFFIVSPVDSKYFYHNITRPSVVQATTAEVIGVYVNSFKLILTK